MAVCTSSLFPALARRPLASDLKKPNPVVSNLFWGADLPCTSQQNLTQETELNQLADELRSDVIFNVSKTGGHSGSSLAVVELTLALHYVFNTQDKILWDVGHQSYPHNILTGRRSKMSMMRQTNGLARFTKRAESEHDTFGTGHSSTTISAGLGNHLMQ